MLRKTLWVSFCMIFVTVMVAQAYIDPANIVGVWLSDEGGGDIAADSSGYGHDGQIQIATWTDGKFGNGLLFDRDGEVRIESTEKLQLGDQLTMMAYFSAQALDHWHQLIAKDEEYLLRIDPPHEDGNMSGFVNLDGDWEPRSSAGVPDMDVWIHFAAVYNSDDGKLLTYVNGELVGEANREGNPNPGDAPVTIGHWGGGSNFVGAIDEVAIFNVALSQDDIQAIMNDGLESVIVTIEGLIAHKEECFASGDIDNRGVANSLDQKLEAAKAALNRGQVRVAVNILNAFINEVAAQSGKHISPECADLLSEYAGRLISVLTGVPQAPSLSPGNKLANTWGGIKRNHN